MRPGIRFRLTRHGPAAGELPLRTAVLRALAPFVLAVATAVAATPDVPASAELLEATPFSLGEALVLPSGETVTAGIVVVLRADAGLTEPRQAAMPVLQCGDRLAHPASRGGGGTLVALVLGDFDLGSSVLFFGAPELPSRVTRDAAARRHADARDAGLMPIGSEKAADALARGAAPLRLRRIEDLSPFLMALRCRIEPEALAEAGTPCAEVP